MGISLIIKVIPLDVVLRRTVDLIEWCEKERVSRGLPKIEGIIHFAASKAVGESVQLPLALHLCVNQ